MINTRTYTSQSIWVSMVARYREIKTLIYLMDKRGLSLNLEHISNIRIELKAMRTNNTLRGAMPYSIMNDVIDEIKDLEKIIGKR